MHKVGNVGIYTNLVFHIFAVSFFISPISPNDPPLIMLYPIPLYNKFGDTIFSNSSDYEEAFNTEKPK